MEHKPCESPECQECCEHGDLDDHFCCLDCGKELAEEIMARAADRAKDFRKYGEW